MFPRLPSSSSGTVASSTMHVLILQVATAGGVPPTCHTNNTHHGGGLCLCPCLFLYATMFDPLSPRTTSRSQPFDAPSGPLALLGVHLRYPWDALIPLIFLFGPTTPRVIRPIAHGSAPSIGVGVGMLGMLVAHVHGTGSSKRVAAPFDETHDFLSDLCALRVLNGQLLPILCVFGTQDNDV